MINKISAVKTSEIRNRGQSIVFPNITENCALTPITVYPSAILPFVGESLSLDPHSF